MSASVMNVGLVPGLLTILTMILASNPVLAYSNDSHNSKASNMKLLDAEWRMISDQVMGGISDGRLQREQVLGRDALCLSGQVSTENNGGFIQMALDLDSTNAPDASTFAGIRLWVMGNQQEYNVHLRTTNLWLPWQSYRASFIANPQWQQVNLPFASFEAYRTGRALDLGKLKRIGLVAIGRDFEAQLCVSDIRFYRD